jgi:hypothetical protein
VIRSELLGDGAGVVNKAHGDEMEA